MLAGIRKLVFSIVSKLRHNCGRTANALWVTITSAITVLRAVQWHEKSCVAIVDNYATVGKKCVTWEGFGYDGMPLECGFSGENEEIFTLMGNSQGSLLEFYYVDSIYCKSISFWEEPKVNGLNRNESGRSVVQRHLMQGTTRRLTREVH